MYAHARGGWLRSDERKVKRCVVTLCAVLYWTLILWFQQDIDIGSRECLANTLVCHNRFHGEIGMSGYCG